MKSRIRGMVLNLDRLVARFGVCVAGPSRAAVRDPATRGVSATRHRVENPHPLVGSSTKCGVGGTFVEDPRTRCGFSTFCRGGVRLVGAASRRCLSQSACTLASICANLQAQSRQTTIRFRSKPIMATTQTKHTNPSIDAAFEHATEAGEQFAAASPQGRQPVPRLLREGRRPRDRARAQARRRDPAGVAQEPDRGPGRLRARADQLVHEHRAHAAEVSSPPPRAVGDCRTSRRPEMKELMAPAEFSAGAISFVRRSG